MAKWSPERPHRLVIACSDGRFQEQLDEFLTQELGIIAYDRLYPPGGPGALATSGFEYARVDLYRRECRFLMEAHQIQEVFLVFHSGSADGPDIAMCADYLRKFPQFTMDQLRAQQEADASELMQSLFSWPPELKIHVYRAETTPENEVRFALLAER